VAEHASTEGWGAPEQSITTSAAEPSRPVAPTAARVLALQRAAGNRATARMLARNGDRSGWAGHGTAIGDTEPSRDYTTDPAYVDRIIDNATYDILANRFQVRHASGRWVDLDYRQIVQDMAAARASHPPGTVTLQVPPVYRDEATGLLFPSFFNDHTAPNICQVVRAIEAQRPEHERQMRDALIEVAVSVHGIAHGALAGSAAAMHTPGRRNLAEPDAEVAGASSRASRFGTVAEAIRSATTRVARRIAVLRSGIRQAMRDGDAATAERLVQQARADADRIRSGTASVLAEEMPQLSQARREELARQLGVAAEQTMERTGVRVEVIPGPPGQVRGSPGGVERSGQLATPRSYGGQRRGP
jgi:hypothetical protein